MGGCSRFGGEPTSRHTEDSSVGREAVLLGSASVRGAKAQRYVDESSWSYRAKISSRKALDQTMCRSSLSQRRLREKKNCFARRRPSTWTNMDIADI
jgi:hypothetical protein